MEAGVLMAEENRWAKYRTQAEEPEEEENRWAKYRQETPSRDDVLKLMAKQDPKLHFARAAYNFPGDVKEAAVGAWETFTNPETYGAALRASRGDVDPRVAMAVTEEVKKAAADPVETMVQNPFDTMTMLSSLPRAGVMEPMRIAGKVIGGAAEKAGQRVYRGALGLPKIPDSHVPPNKLAEAGTKNRIGLNPEGMERISDVERKLKRDVDMIAAEATAEGKVIPVAAINRYLGQLAETYRGTPGGQKNMRIVNRLRYQLFEEFGNTATITPEQLVKFKRSANTQVFERASDVQRRFEPKTKVLREQARASKDYLHDRFPEIAVADEAYSAVAELEKILPGAANRVSKLEPSLRKVVLETIARPDVRARIGIGLQRIADGDIKGLETFLNSREIRTVLALTGAGAAGMEEE